VCVCVCERCVCVQDNQSVPRGGAEDREERHQKSRQKVRDEYSTWAGGLFACVCFAY